MTIRDKILSAKKDFKKIEFDFEGEKLFIREPSIKESNEATQLYFTKDNDGKSVLKDDANIDVTMYYLCNLVTDADGNKIFEPTDRDTIFNHGANGVFAHLINDVLSFVRGETEKK